MSPDNDIRDFLRKYINRGRKEISLSALNVDVQQINSSVDGR